MMVPKINDTSARTACTTRYPVGLPACHERSLSHRFTRNVGQITQDQTAKTSRKTEARRDNNTPLRVGTSELATTTSIPRRVARPARGLPGERYAQYLDTLRGVAPVSRLCRAVLTVVALTALSAPLAVQPALAQPDSQRLAPTCTDRDLPPPPVDTSEEPKPGQPSPKPLPVPERPAGGERMAECGLVLPEGAPPLPSRLTPQSWVLADLDTGEVLAAHDPHARHRPASLIKVLLALVVIDELDPDATVRVTQQDANQEGTSVGIVPNKTYTVDKLLHGLLMHSGNDVAHALARKLGSVPAALGKMNALANKLGAKDTRAATPSGLDGPGMTTSAYDFGLLMRAAMNTPEFVEAVHTQRVRFPGRSGQPGYEVYNDNKLLGTYPGFIGGKTGFTDDARHTYTGAAERGGRRIVVSMLRGEQRPIRMSDQARLLLDYGFALAEEKTPAVGKLVEPPKPKSAVQRNTAAQGKASAGEPERSSFGSVGGPLLALVVVVLALIGLFWLRRRSRQTHG